jgi:hypothetical protein
MQLDEAVSRLESLFPLKQRQERLAPGEKAIHQALLYAFYDLGRPLTQSELMWRFSDLPIVQTLKHLHRKDLLLTDKESGEVFSVYPFTQEHTQHRVHVNEKRVHATCPLDALAISSMFDVQTHVESRCYLSETPLAIRLLGDLVTDCSPSSDVFLGIRWQTPVGNAAYSLCTDMAFLLEHNTARVWQNSWPGEASLFSIHDAAKLSGAFFSPLVL